MKPIYGAEFMQIEVTNHCPMKCAYCTRFIRHLKSDQFFNISVDDFYKILDSLEQWPNKIGIIGGEPTLHPKFERLCEILQNRFPRDRCALWSSGSKKYDEHEQIIGDTFYHVAYNEHDAESLKVQKHQPILVSVDDVVEDEEYKEELIDRCWLQRIWSPSAGPNGGFFCEVATNLDRLLDMDGGYSLDDPMWWNKTPEEFKDQVDKYCPLCGMPVPLDNEFLTTERERISKGLYDKFREHNLSRSAEKDFRIVEDTFSTDELEAKRRAKWDPANYHQESRSDMKEGWKYRYADKYGEG